MTDLHWLGVVDTARAIAARQLSPVDVVQACLDRIARLDGKLKSYLAVFGDYARATARSAEGVAMVGQGVGPLLGVPIAVKDLYDVHGTPTTGGSTILNEPAARDCTVVAKLRAAGAIILGKLNLHEFAYGPEGLNPHFGSPWNPWDATTHRMAGGSSSGSGVAVAAGLIPMGMGSDTGGSIRIPAACCGTVGLKATYGRISKAGVLPLAWSLDHAGPLTRSVADAAAILQVIAGHDPADPTSSTAPVGNYLAEIGGPVAGLRVGILTGYVNEAAPEVQAAVQAAAHQLQSLGCTLREVNLPLAKYGLAIASSIMGPEALSYHAPMLKQHASQYAVDVRRRILAGAVVSGSDYVTGQRARGMLRAEVSEALTKCDVLLAPTLPIAAPPVTATEVQLAQRTEGVRLALTMYTRLFNLTGHPVVSLPCGFSKEGMPLSMQVVGRAFDEGTILRVARAYEEATEWHLRRPPV